MDPNTFPTKGNLILAKNSLALANMGYDLMDKKRNILIREMMDLIDKAKEIQSQIRPHVPEKPIPPCKKPIWTTASAM